MKGVRSMSSFDSAEVSQAPGFGGVEGFTHPTAGQGVERSAGELLRAAREGAGLHIAALAVMLKVPVKKLEALEASRFDLLPDMVFVRALASSVCRTLKVDSAPVLERLPQTGAPPLTYQGSSINAPFRSPGDSAGPSVWSGLPKPAVAAAALLLLASVALFFWPAVSTQVSQLTSAITARVATNKSSVEITPVSPEIGLRGEKAMSSSLPPMPNATGIVVAPVVSSAGPQTGQIAADAASLAPTAASAVVTPPANVPVDSVLVFTAVGESWVEVTDAKRQTVLRRTLTAGESVGVSGALPLSATVGRASMTRVNVRGQGFDLGPWSKDNVARFEVK